MDLWSTLNLHSSTTYSIIYVHVSIEVYLQARLSAIRVQAGINYISLLVYNLVTVKQQISVRDSFMRIMQVKRWSH